VLLDEALEGEGGVETVEFEVEGFVFGGGSEGEVVVFVGLLGGVDDFHDFGECGEEELEMFGGKFVVEEEFLNFVEGEEEVLVVI
jgi:hypothetical protein